MRIAVLASGRGSNLAVLIQGIADGAIQGRIVGVFSDRPACQALQIASGAGIFVHAASPKDFSSREAFDESLFNAISRVQPDLIVCAGFMRIISETAVQAFRDRMINIHPSLLPKYPGLHTHRRALEAGDTQHGASIHVVIPALDAGPVIAQARIEVCPGENAEDLAQRVLQLEHPLLLASVAAICDRRICVENGNVFFNSKILDAPLQFHDGKLQTELN